MQRAIYKTVAYNMTNKVLKLNISTLILLLVVYSCSSEKKSNIVQKDLTNLEIRLPFESSNNVYENEINFELYNLEGKKMESEFDTVTKTGGHINYLLEKGKYSYSIKTPFNEIIKRELDIKKDTVLGFYESCYNKVKQLSLNDLKNSEKINISIAYEYDSHSNDEIEISKKENQYLISLNGWTDKISTDNSQIIDAINRFEKDIYRMEKNKIIGTEEFSYLSASQVFIKYDDKLYEVHNIKHDSLMRTTNELKQKINKIL